jgi:predicted permease
MRALTQDLRYAIRMMLKNPAFTAIVVGTLALGIGANTAVFSVVNSVLIRPLPFADADDLVLLWKHTAEGGTERGWISTGLYGAVRDQNQTFEELAILDGHSAVFRGDGAPERIRGICASSSCLPLLGATPALGRLFAPDEDLPGAPPSIILSHALWVRRFNADPAIIGTGISTDEGDYTVVGVLEEGFSVTREHLPMLVRSDYWVTVPLGPDAMQEHRRHSYGLIARLAPGVTPEGARSDMRAIAARLMQVEPEAYPSDSGFTIAVQPFADHVVGEARPALWLLFGAIGLVTLIACANVANLLLARTTARRREIGIRLAVGAGRRRVVRQLLTESTILSLAGGVLGLLLAAWTLSLLLHLGDKAIPRAHEVGIDWQVIAFTLGLSLITSLVFGLAPALTASRINLSHVLRQDGASLLGGSVFRRLRHSARHWVVVGELAVSLILLVGAGLLLNSFWRLQQVDAGFSPDNVLTFQLAARGDKYSDHDSVVRFYEQLDQRVADVPGVRAAGGVSIIPFGPNHSSNKIQIEDQLTDGSTAGVTAESRVALGDYFRTMEIPLLAGRCFDARDTRTTPPVAIIDEHFAQRFWPDEDPIGKRFRLADFPDFRMTVVGVVGSIKHYHLDAEPRITFYQPHAQCAWQYMYVVVSTESDPEAMIGTLAGEIWAADEELPLMRVASMEQRVSDSLAQRRFLLLLLGGFAGIALMLAAVGLYGVMAYLVGRSTHDIGVRMAVGAQPADVLRIVLRQGAILAAAGLGLGLAISLPSMRVLSGHLFQISPLDPLTFFGVSAALFAAALLACMIPARRAMRVDPMVALRCE